MASPADGGDFRCARCLAGFPRCETSLGHAQRRTASQHALHRLDSWQLDAELESADDFVQRHRGPAAPKPRPQRRIDGPHVRQTARRPTARRQPSGLFSWGILAAGLSCTVFGSVLIVWSIWGGRADLWPLGVPCTLAGQGVLMLGLLLQLETLWRGNRMASLEAEQLREAVGELRQQLAQRPTPGQQAWPSSFYSHLSSGASPQVLLADLRGQLDLLAEKVGESS